MSNKLRFGLPKGSVQDATIEKMAKAGFNIQVSSRSYIPYVDDDEMEIRLIRAQEISRYVEHGYLDCGITGHDWIIENGSKVCKAHFNNNIGSIVTYEGVAPIIVPGTSGLTGDIYEQLQRLISYAYQQEGVSAMTAITSAIRPLVHQSFSPLMMKCLPSSVGVAVVSILRGSEPTLGSVRAKADIAPSANMGKYFFFCSGVPKSFSGWGTPMLWCAERSTAVDPQ